MMNLGYFVAEWFIALVTVLVCVWIHSRVLMGLALGRNRLPRGQHRIFLILLILLVTHIVEMIIFAAAYAVLLRDPAFGQIAQAGDMTFVDCIYFFIGGLHHTGVWRSGAHGFNPNPDRCGGLTGFIANRVVHGQRLYRDPTGDHVPGSQRRITTTSLNQPRGMAISWIYRHQSR